MLDSQASAANYGLPSKMSGFTVILSNNALSFIWLIIHCLIRLAPASNPTTRRCAALTCWDRRLFRPLMSMSRKEGGRGWGGLGGAGRPLEPQSNCPQLPRCGPAISMPKLHAVGGVFQRPLYGGDALPPTQQVSLRPSRVICFPGW